MKTLTQITKEIELGTKLKKEDGTVVSATKVGFAGKEVVYGLSDGTMVFKDDIGKRIKIINKYKTK